VRHECLEAGATVRWQGPKEVTIDKLCLVKANVRIEAGEEKGQVVRPRQDG
jgi:hypothetical protein